MFNGRTLFLTGASGAIGQAVARQFHDSGSNLFLTDLAIGPVENLAEGFGTPERVRFSQADVSNPGDMDAAVAKCVGAFGGMRFRGADGGILPRASFLCDESRGMEQGHQRQSHWGLSHLQRSDISTAGRQLCCCGFFDCGASRKPASLALRGGKRRYAELDAKYGSRTRATHARQCDFSRNHSDGNDEEFWWQPVEMSWSPKLRWAALGDPRRWLPWPTSCVATRRASSPVRPFRSTVASTSMARQCHSKL